MKFTLNIVFSVFLVLIMVAVVQAQPGLPSTPSQAPIDGGLSILAAAGGAYAWKKLKSRNGDKDFE